MEASVAQDVPAPADVPKGVRVAVRLTQYSSPASFFLRWKVQGIPDGEAQDDLPISPTSKHVNEAFIGMSCLVCQFTSRILALRAVVTDVHSNSSRIPSRVDVLYVDSGRTDVVGLDCVHTIDAETTEGDRMLHPQCDANSRELPFRFGAAVETGHALRSCFLYGAGVHEVDLYAKCHDNKSRVKTYDVGKYLVESGLAKFVGYLADTPVAVGSFPAQGIFDVSFNSYEGTQNGTLQQPFRMQPSSSKAPRGRESALAPVPNRAMPSDAAREELDNPLRSRSRSISSGDSLAATNFGARRGRRICSFYATHGFCREGERCPNSHGSSSPPYLSEAVIDPVKPLRPPEVGSCVLGQVTAVVSPSCFYLVFPYGRRSIERLSTDGMGRNSRETLKKLTRDLQVACNKGGIRENRRVLKAQGELVAAKSCKDGRWYRARVVSLGAGDMYKVFYMDFGFCESVPFDHVKTIDVRFTHLPQQALQACLVTDKTNNRLDNKPIWDEHSCEAFANIVSRKDLVVKVVCVTQGLLHVRLFFRNGDRLGSVWRCLREALEIAIN